MDNKPGDVVYGYVNSEIRQGILLDTMTVDFFSGIETTKKGNGDIHITPNVRRSYVCLDSKGSFRALYLDKPYPTRKAAEEAREK